ncbi:tRNA (guanine-N(1)-)-methyltransferase [Aquimixticola soesokkakensis]|uniref:tRNA (guanine-N(1)-)-methyltransferase n=1 Tax=Aquimixticola soesokkakensis TaxID=1519096 RepID=A0A1Y5T015_9RHOB|nr:tRNA (guanosine(37)-N1)-methyltransferase TrmD [Aquimixticola soesokkakensis]SLN52020.1 tRNA (guanine-N(1)-)-methyltransferase [Aquimixticola soesokkakensis]
MTDDRDPAPNAPANTPVTEPLKSHGRLAVSATLRPRELMSETPDLAGVWKAKVITLLPAAFPGILGESLTGKALKDGLWQVEPIDLRIFGEGKHRNVDDTPAGGGAGMVLRPDIMGKAIDFAQNGAPVNREEWPLVYLSPRGKRFDQKMAQKWAGARGVTLICGRFEGLDERVITHFGIEEVSLGDFVLTGGELAAQAMLDATVRLIPGVLGNADSIEDESHSAGLLEHPQYTKPAEWRGHAIPEVLQSGHHGKIADWRDAQSRAITKARRPDMWEAFEAANPPTSKKR